MFGFLKKKLKEGIEKISKAVSEKEEKKIEEAVEEIKKEEHIEEPKKELIREVEKQIEEAPEVKEEEIEEKAEEIVEKVAEEKIEESKEILETAKEIEHLKEEKPSEKAVELFEKKVEEKLTETEEKKAKESYEEFKKEQAKEEKPKRRLFGLLKGKPKEVKIEEKVAKPKEEKGIIEKIKSKVTEKKIEEDDVKDILNDFETSLISSDVAVEVSEKIVNDLRNNLVGKFIKRKEIENVIKNSFKDSILDILNVESFDLVEKVKTKKPFLIVFLGFNGSGKTTSIARIGYLLKKNGISSVLAAADCFRAASIEQLEEHGKKLGVEVIKHKYGADPAAVIFDSVKHAQAKNIDVVLADTAGRTHSNVNLMDELKKIIKVNKPDLKILVVDALTGNDVYDQCKMFNDAVGVDAIIVTKADVYERGGATLSASYTIKKPIIYLGVGQNYEDLEKFDSKKIVEKLLE